VSRDVLLVGDASVLGAVPPENAAGFAACFSPAEALGRLRSGMPCDVVVIADLPATEGVNLLADT